MQWVTTMARCCCKEQPGHLLDPLPSLAFALLLNRAILGAGKHDWAIHGGRAATVEAWCLRDGNSSDGACFHSWEELGAIQIPWSMTEIAQVTIQVGSCQYVHYSQMKNPSDLKTMEVD